MTNSSRDERQQFLGGGQAEEDRRRLNMRTRAEQQNVFTEEMSSLGIASTT